MPTTLDRETIQRLLSEIDKPHTVSVLKVGYFMRRREPELPKSEGFALLKAAVEAETVGSRKWFLLQNLRAFVAFRVAEVDTDEGFAAYDALFARAGDAAKVGAEYPLRQAIHEFVTSVSGKFKNLGLKQDPKTQATLLNAWTAYAILPATKAASAAQLEEPDWNAAIEQSGVGKSFMPHVERVLADATVPKTFALLFAAASVLSSENPDRALTLFLQAKLLLPLQNGQPEINQAARFYEAYVELLTSRQRIAEAIQTQSEFVTATKRGQAKLMLLHRANKEEAQVERLLAELSKPTTPEIEITEAASELLKLAFNRKTPDVKAGEQAEKLLKSYLAAPRPRDVEAELQARLTLASLYLRQNKSDDAKTILASAPAPAKPTVRARNLIRAMKRMKERLEATQEAPRVPLIGR